MAEIVGLAASIIQIAGAGSKLSITLYNFVGSAARADQEIGDIAEDVGMTATALDSVAEVFKDANAQSVVSKKAVQDAANLIKRCEDVFGEINEVINKRRKVRGGSGSGSGDGDKKKEGKMGLSMVGRFSWPLKEQRVELLRRRLESLKNSLILLLHVLQLATAQANGKIDNSALEQERETIRSLHRHQQESLKCLQALESKFSKVALDDDETLSGSVAPSRVNTVDFMASSSVFEQLKPTEPKQSAQEKSAKIDDVLTDDSEMSESDATAAENEEDELTVEELAKCARHVQKLLKRISTLQQSFETAQPKRKMPKHRVHKLYRRFCDRFESEIPLVMKKSTSSTLNLPSFETLKLPDPEPPSSPKPRLLMTHRPDSTGTTKPETTPVLVRSEHFQHHHHRLSPQALPPHHVPLQGPSQALPTTRSYTKFIGYNDAPTPPGSQNLGPPSVVGKEGMPTPAARPLGPKLKFTTKDDELLIQLREEKGLDWKQIADFFPGRSSGTLQVRYCTKLRNPRRDGRDESASRFDVPPEDEEDRPIPPQIFSPLTSPSATITQPERPASRSSLHGEVESLLDGVSEEAQRDVVSFTPLVSPNLTITQSESSKSRPRIDGKVDPFFDVLKSPTIHLEEVDDPETKAPETSSLSDQEIRKEIHELTRLIVAAQTGTGQEQESPDQRERAERCETLRKRRDDLLFKQREKLRKRSGNLLPEQYDTVGHDKSPKTLAELEQAAVTRRSELLRKRRVNRWGEQRDSLRQWSGNALPKQQDTMSNENSDETSTRLDKASVTDWSPLHRNHISEPATPHLLDDFDFDSFLHTDDGSRLSEKALNFRSEPSIPVQEQSKDAESIVPFVKPPVNGPRPLIYGPTSEFPSESPRSTQNRDAESFKLSDPLLNYPSSRKSKDANKGLTGSHNENSGEVKFITVFDPQDFKRKDTMKKVRRRAMNDYLKTEQNRRTRSSFSEPSKPAQAQAQAQAQVRNANQMLQGQIGGLNLPPGTQQQSPAMPMLTRPMVPPGQPAYPQPMMTQQFIDQQHITAQREAESKAQDQWNGPSLMPNQQRAAAVMAQQQAITQQQTMAQNQAMAQQQLNALQQMVQQQQQYTQGTPLSQTANLQSASMPMLTRPMLPPRQMEMLSQPSVAHVPQMNPLIPQQDRRDHVLQLMREAQQRAQLGPNQLSTHERLRLIPPFTPVAIRHTLMNMPEPQFRAACARLKEQPENFLKLKHGLEGQLEIAAELAMWSAQSSLLDQGQQTMYQEASESQQASYHTVQTQQAQAQAAQSQQQQLQPQQQPLQQSYPQPQSAAQVPQPESHAHQLRDYQMNLLTLDCRNRRGRKMMYRVGEVPDGASSSILPQENNVNAVGQNPNVMLPPQPPQVQYPNAENRPLFVNPKQFNRILKRRLDRVHLEERMRNGTFAGECNIGSEDDGEDLTDAEIVEDGETAEDMEVTEDARKAGDNDIMIEDTVKENSTETNQEDSTKAPPISAAPDPDVQKGEPQESNLAARAGFEEYPAQLRPGKDMGSIGDTEPTFNWDYVPSYPTVKDQGPAQEEQQVHQYQQSGWQSSGDISLESGKASVTPSGKMSASGEPQLHVPHHVLKRHPPEWTAENRFMAPPSPSAQPFSNTHGTSSGRKRSRPEERMEDTSSHPIYQPPGTEAYVSNYLEAQGVQGGTWPYPSKPGNHPSMASGEHLAYGWPLPPPPPPPPPPVKSTRSGSDSGEWVIEELDDLGDVPLDRKNEHSAGASAGFEVGRLGESTTTVRQQRQRFSQKENEKDPEKASQFDMVQEQPESRHEDTSTPVLYGWVFYKPSTSGSKLVPAGADGNRGRRHYGRSKALTAEQRRNAAQMRIIGPCSNCRKRKEKCDTQTPCKACVKHYKEDLVNFPCRRDGSDIRDPNGEQYHTISQAAGNDNSLTSGKLQDNYPTNDESDVEAAAGLSAMRMAETQEEADEAHRRSSNAGLFSGYPSMPSPSPQTVQKVSPSAQEDYPIFNDHVDVMLYGEKLASPIVQIESTSLTSSPSQELHIRRNSGTAASTIDTTAHSLPPSTSLPATSHKINPIPLLAETLPSKDSSTRSFLQPPRETDKQNDEQDSPHPSTYPEVDSDSHSDASTVSSGGPESSSHAFHKRLQNFFADDAPGPIPSRPNRPSHADADADAYDRVPSPPHRKRKQENEGIEGDAESGVETPRIRKRGRPPRMRDSSANNVSMSRSSTNSLSASRPRSGYKRSFAESNQTVSSVSETGGREISGVNKGRDGYSMHDRFRGSDGFRGRDGYSGVHDGRDGYRVVLDRYTTPPVSPLLPRAPISPSDLHPIGRGSSGMDNSDRRAVSNSVGYADKEGTLRASGSQDPVVSGGRLGSSMGDDGHGGEGKEEEWEDIEEEQSSPETVGRASRGGTEDDEEVECEIGDDADEMEVGEGEEERDIVDILLADWTTLPV